ncbi:MAG TPA: DUF4190 domain-containing protein [Bacteroidia bacterium]|nr:DUF4190 domain-containing protein [Bacteroidia bacterium]
MQRIKTFTKTISLVLAIGFLASCSMEKRVYMRGYHVEWNKKENTIAAQNEIIARPEFKNQVKKKSGEIIHVNTGNESKTTTASLSVDKTLFQKSEKKDTTHYTIKKKQINAPPQNNTAQESDGNKKTNRMASISFTFAAFTLIGLIVAFIFGWGVFVFLALFSIPALIFGIIALTEFKNNPGVYDNKWNAFLGVIIGAIETLALLLFSGIYVSDFL